MPKTMTNAAGDIFRQEIGALANADGEARGAIFFNTLRDGSLLAAVSVHAFTEAGAPEQRPTYHSGWFAQADSAAARSALQYLQVPPDLNKVLFRQQYSILTTVHFGPVGHA